MRGPMQGRMQNETSRGVAMPLLAIAALVCAGAVPLLRAQAPGDGNFPYPSDTNTDYNNDAAYADPPSRAARLGWIEGNVTFQPGGVEDWVPATLNRPITTGDRLWTDAGARAELHLGSAAFRLAGRTNFTFVNLTDTFAQVQVSSGTLVVRVRGLSYQDGVQESIEIDTPQAALTIARPGEYRVDVTEQGEATIATVRGGEAEIAAEGQAFPLDARQQVRVMDENGQPVFDRRTAPVADAFDNWCANRDRREDTSQSARYVSREMPGYADLDDNGVWTEEPGYGRVWAPRVEIGWAPYHNGHWAWVEPWGWTWIDDAPWGYAPFHYGRWAYVRSGWVWVPGPVVVGVRPVYSPALVAWVGGARFGISIGIGAAPAVGWFPLGPREVWVPPYRHSGRYIENVNVTNTVIVNRTVIRNVNVTNVNYMNRGVPGGVTAVPQATLYGGRPVRGSAVVVAPGVAMQAEVGMRASVAPQRGAVLGGRDPSRYAPPAGISNRGMVARTAPPSAPVSFNQRQVLLQQNPGQPLNQTQLGQIQQAQPQQQERRYRSAMPQQQPNVAPAGVPQNNFPQNNFPQNNVPQNGGAQGGFGQGQNNRGFGGRGQQQGGYQPLGTQPNGQTGGQSGSAPGGNVYQPPVNPNAQPGNRGTFGQQQQQGVGGNPPGGPGGFPAGQTNPSPYPTQAAPQERRGRFPQQTQQPPQAAPQQQPSAPPVQQVPQYTPPPQRPVERPADRPIDRPMDRRMGQQPQAAPQQAAPVQQAPQGNPGRQRGDRRDEKRD